MSSSHALIRKQVNARGTCSVGRETKLEATVKLEGVRKNEVRQVGCTQMQMPVMLRW